MSRPRRALWALLLLAAGAAGCSHGADQRQPRARSVRLSSANKDDNAAAIADLVRRTCLAAIGDQAALAAAVNDSGWAAESVAPGGGDAPAVWRLDYGEIVHAAMVAPGGRFGDCVIALDPEIAPRPEKMRDALAPLLGPQARLQPAGNDGAIEWQWRPGAGEERQLTIGPRLNEQGDGGIRPGLSIHFASAHYDPRPPAEPAPAPAEAPGAAAPAVNDSTGDAGN